MFLSNTCDQCQAISKYLALISGCFENIRQKENEEDERKLMSMQETIKETKQELHRKINESRRATNETLKYTQ